MNLVLNDLQAEYQSIKTEIDTAVQRILDNSTFILGKEVEEFEEQFANYIGVKHCIATSSCTAALHMAVQMLRKDDILVPVRTVTADAEAVVLAGSKLKFYDENFGGQSAGGAIIVHLYGKPSPLINTTTIPFIEDCAQATGAEINGQKVGTFGRISCFSFFPSKVLGCMGDGGALCTNDDKIARDVRALRNHGRLKGKKHEHNLIGYNYRLDALQAAVLKVKLPHLDNWIGLRRKWAKLYLSHLGGGFDEGSVYYVFTREIPDRDEMYLYLRGRGIRCGIHYPYTLNQHSPYRWASFPKAEDWAKDTISLPMHPFLNEEKVEYVCKHFTEFLAKKVKE